MRTIRTWAVLVAFGGTVVAAPPEVRHYLGEVKLSGPDGKAYGSQVILLEKTHDPDKSEIVERAILVKPDGKAEDHTVRLKVDGDKFTASDAADSIEGGGTLSGPAWKWTHLKGVFAAKNGVRIEDENFLADPSVLTARKTLTGADRKVMLRMDMTLKAVTPATFEILTAAVLKK